MSKERSIEKIREKTNGRERGSRLCDVVYEIVKKGEREIER